MLLLKSSDATAALQHLALKRGNRRSTRTTSPNMQTAPLQPSHQQKMHQTRVLPGRGVASYPLQSSPPNFQHLPNTQPGPLQTNQTNQLPLRYRRALQPKKLQRKHLHPLLLDFHRGLHDRETPGRVSSHDRAHLVYRLEQNRRRRSAPHLDCDPCGSSVGCDLFATLMACQPLGRLSLFLARALTYGVSAPWPTAFVLGAPLSAAHLHCYHCWNHGLRRFSRPTPSQSSFVEQHWTASSTPLVCQFRTHAVAKFRTRNTIHQSDGH